MGSEPSQPSATDAEARDEQPRDATVPFTWTAAQRRALIVLLGLATLYLAGRYALTPTYIADPQPAHPARYDELADRIDPNTAELDVLMALPTLGEKRARDIVEHRQWLAARRPGRPAFRAPEDLLAIKGFGPATIETLRPFLVFPATAPATQP